MSENATCPSCKTLTPTAELEEFSGLCLSCREAEDDIAAEAAADEAPRDDDVPLPEEPDHPWEDDEC